MAIVRGARGPAGAGPTLSSATPQPLGTATAGVSTEASRADHVHTLPTIPALASTTPAALGVAAVGVGTTAARADHVHALPTIPAVSSATPQPIGTATAGVSTDAARADHVHAPDTSLQSAPDTGWTAAGTGSASISGGVITETLTAAQSVAVLRRTMACSPALPAIELSARVTVTTVPASGAYYAGLAILNTTVPNNAGSTRGIAVFVNPPNAIANVNPNGAWAQPASAALPATLTSGTLWLRIVYGAGYVSWYAGTGATRPTSWTRIHTATAPDLTWQDVDQVALYAERAGGGSGDYVVQWSDIQWRSLLGAPA